jgi:hypothetical protein
MTDTEGKQRFLAAHDYGMGGIWMYITAKRASDITDAYPELEIFEEPPSFISEATLAKIEEKLSYDLDDPPEYLKALADRRGK